MENNYGSIPFWAVNGEMRAEDIRNVIREAQEAGCEGVFVHPRPGLMTEYLSEEWFELFSIALSEAKLQGIRLYLYDENTYPSGYAGGHVMSRLPDCAARSVKGEFLKDGQAFAALRRDPVLSEEKKHPLKIYQVLDRDGQLELEDLSLEEPERVEQVSDQLLILWCQEAFQSDWYGGFSAPDLLRPEVTREFLHCTYEAYYKRFGEDFGTWIPAIFSDEPGITPGCIYLEDPLAFPYSPYLSMEFYRRCHYSLEDTMAAICVNTESLNGRKAESIRFDYYRVLHELWRDNFAIPIRDWCHAHQLKWTGHFLDEHWPSPWGCCSPDIMAMYEFMDWPGVDMLMTDMLKRDGTSPMYLSLKELSSAGNQLGKERLLCECYGAGGWDASIEDFKRIADYLAVHGINLFNPHLILHSLKGSRKYGHPQSFDSWEPWWEEFKELNGYLGQLCHFLSQGTEENRVLVLHPTLSWFTRLPGSVQGNILWNYQDFPADSPVFTYLETLQYFRRTHLDYDLGDELLMERHADVENNRLRVGRQTYEAVYLPKEAEWLKGTTIQLIKKAIQAGIRVSAGRETFRCLETGEIIQFSSAVRENPGEFVQKMKKDGYCEEFPEGVDVRRKQNEDGARLYFITNSTPQEQTFRMELEGFYEINLWKKVRKKVKKGKLPYTLYKGQSLLLVEEQWLLEAFDGYPEQDEKTFVQPVREKGEMLPLSRALPLDNNLLVLDYGSLKLCGKQYQEQYVLDACDEIYRRHGFWKNPWDMQIQFRDRIISHRNYPVDSGFSFAWEFFVEEVPEKLWVAIESSELYTCQINGKEVLLGCERTMLHQELFLTDIRAYVQNGKNELVLTGAPFQVRMELAPIYLAGNFRLKQNGNEYWICRETPLTMGSLKEQGMPFYGGRLAYWFGYDCQVKRGPVLLDPGVCEGTALSVWVNQRFAGTRELLGTPFLDISEFIRSGNNEIRIELSCSLKNVYGPFHTREKIRNRAWPGAFREAPRFGKPLPENYDVIEYGLIGPVRILTSKDA